MQDAYQPKDALSRTLGLAMVVALHLLLAWALVFGTARQGLAILETPPQVVVIREVFVAPPPLTPPPPKEIQPRQARVPTSASPVPPPFVPPPEAPPATAATPAIAATPTPPLAPPVTAPPPPPAAAAPAAAVVAAIPAAAPALAKVTPKADVGVDCPTQVKPIYPPMAAKVGVEGVVKVEVMVRDGAIDDKDIQFLSGPVALRAAVRIAMRQYKCSREPSQYLITQEFPFKLKE